MYIVSLEVKDAIGLENGNASYAFTRRRTYER